MAKQVEKKKFFLVQVPILKKEIELLGREGEFEGRHVKLDLTNALKGKGLEIKLMVIEKEGKLTTTPKQIYLQGFYIRRMLRKGTDYVEDSFLTECKDNRIRVKPFLITRKRVSREVLNGLRIKAKEEISKYVKEKDFNTIVKEIMDGNLQKHILPALKKIYPLGLCEIRFVGIENLKEHERYEAEQAEEVEIKKENLDKEEKIQEDKDKAKKVKKDLGKKEKTEENLNSSDIEKK